MTTNFQRKHDKNSRGIFKEPKKSISQANHELLMTQSTVWRVLKRCLHMKPYRLQLLQALNPADKGK
ncbi:hypothetical protein J437_LFUL001410 [Ladona fulva]|uniref:Uncharacterized protein n=1 Tax=Ladona fulva TaxID=123851 RepID=A0A8K0NU96_LADFU|nr:hypothetical protein J437_LFUL001410 [Ladona fulva]